MEKKYYLADVESLQELIDYLEHRAGSAELDDRRPEMVSFTPKGLRMIADIIRNSLPQTKATRLAEPGSVVNNAEIEE